MYHQYFDDEQNVSSDFRKQFISLWPGWLGKENYHKLDEVTEKEWARFNYFLERVGKDFEFELVSHEERRLVPLVNVSSVISSYEESQQKEASQFLQLVIPDLGCVITEEWDYTYILWYKDTKTAAVLESYIHASELHSFG